MSDTPNLKNIKNILGGITYVVNGQDDVINVDTSVVGGTTLLIPNIKAGSLQLFYKDIFVNDIGGNASTNKIRIAAVGGDLINGSPFIEIENDSASVQLTVAGQKTWLANFGSATSGSGQDDKVKVNATDALTQYLQDKLVQGDGITITEQDVLGVKSLILASTGVEIRNTLYVSKNGNDGTGERNRLDKPYATIAAAAAASSVNDCIYVYAGDYTEGDNDWCLSDRHYYFEPNAKVIGFTYCIYDFGQERNIFIYGYGDFENISLNFARGCVWSATRGTNLYIRAQRIHGAAQALQLLGCNYDIETVDLSCDSQYVVNCNGNGDGRLKWTGVMQTFSTAALMQYRSLGTDLENHKHVIEGGIMRGNSSAFGAGMIAPILNQGTNVTIEVKNVQFEHSSEEGGGLIYLWDTGKIWFDNCSGISPNGYGINTQTGRGTALFTNCNLGGQAQALNAAGDFDYSFKNCTLVASRLDDRVIGAVDAQNSTKLEFDNCTITNNAAFPNVKVLSIVGAETNVRMRYTKFVGQDDNSESISADVATNISVEGGCATNRPISSNITNLVAGTNIVVDSNIQNNPNNFFNI